MVGGDDEVSRFHDPTVNDDYDVQLRLTEGDRNDPRADPRASTCRGRERRARTGSTTSSPLNEATTASRIDRLDRQRQVSLRAGVAPGFALADRLEALQQAVEEMNLPRRLHHRASPAAAASWSAPSASSSGRSCSRSSSCT